MTRLKRVVWAIFWVAGGGDQLLLWLLVVVLM